MLLEKMTKILNGQIRSNYNYKIDIRVFPRLKRISKKLERKYQKAIQLRANSSEILQKEKSIFPPIKKIFNHINISKIFDSKNKSVAKYPNLNQNMNFRKIYGKNNDLKNLELSHKDFQDPKIIQHNPDQIPKVLLYKKTKILAKEKYFIELLKVGE